MWIFVIHILSKEVVDLVYWIMARLILINLSFSFSHRSWLFKAYFLKKKKMSKPFPRVRHCPFEVSYRAIKKVSPLATGGEKPHSFTLGYFCCINLFGFLSIQNWLSCWISKQGFQGLQVFCNKHCLSFDGGEVQRHKVNLLTQTNKKQKEK